MPNVRTWPQQRKWEQRQRLKARREWILREKRSDDTLTSMSVRLKIERATFCRMVNETDLRGEFRRFPGTPGPKPKAPKEPRKRIQKKLSIADLNPRDRKLYETMRRELNITHKEALYRLAVEAGVHA